jgi:hypothetical protein
VLQNVAGRARPLKSGSSGSRRRESALLPCTTGVREVVLMRTVLIVMAVLAVLGAVSLVGVFGIVTPIATVAILLVPATFMVSLVIGFASRRRTWFG